MWTTFINTLFILYLDELEPTCGLFDWYHSNNSNPESTDNIRIKPQNKYQEDLSSFWYAESSYAFSDSFKSQKKEFHYNSKAMIKI